MAQICPGGIIQNSRVAIEIRAQPSKIDGKTERRKRKVWEEEKIYQPQPEE